jgi:hypothetical protein
LHAARGAWRRAHAINRNASCKHGRDPKST